jgi:cytochrome c-type biogenesis protein CcmH
MMISFWVSIGVMCVVAALFVAWPLYRRQQRLSPLTAATVVAVVALGAGLYAAIGNPEAPPDGAALSDIDDMVTALARRLEDDPTDLKGWTMLGRSYMSLGNYAGAADAFERATELESSRNAQTLVGLAEAILARDNSRIEGRVSALFESALSIEPNNPTALFYGGIGAFNRGNKEIAATRWEKLLGLNPPEEIQNIMRQRIAEWRGQPPPTPVERPGAVVSADVSVSKEAAATLPAEATVFVIARDPNAPSPPIAVTRRRLSELPTTVELRDQDSMIPGRSLSGFAEFELVARVSVSGEPVARSGDWFASAIVNPSESRDVNLAIQEQVP